MPVRGVRGATTVGKNDREEILERTGELLRALVERNGIAPADIASAVFSVTGDIDAEFPAVAARRMGWIYTPLMCTREIPVQGSLPLCIRVLLHVNTDRPQEDIIHLYLREARKLRPDLDTDHMDRYYRSEL
ncbi:MAG TPA: chorismate mutase [Spirochaetota bacterium]|nr:chorismate mutase [Spirochaetota bacterium]